MEDDRYDEDREREEWQIEKNDLEDQAGVMFLEAFIGNEGGREKEEERPGGAKRGRTEIENDESA